MKRLLLLTILLVSVFASYAQNLSFSCPQDTILGCNTACFTLKHRFPDIRSLSSDYTVSDVSSQSACRPYVNPGSPGTPTGITVDDTYSGLITLPFNFSFYGSLYNQIVISTNGLISFDASEAGNFSTYSMLNNGGTLSATAGTPQDLPSTLYDKGLIMGPFHDIDPGTTSTSPNLQIKYDIVGSAPTRKFVFSFYKVPLFNCDDSINNTHQIILYESTGVVEVDIVDKQICTTWNDGRAMVGMQDFTQTKAIMAPGRKASDPQWRGIGMNEVWRFVPKDGPTLYRKVELLDNAGALLATGDTTRIDANTFEASFPNVCPPAGASVVVLKITYQKIDDPTQTIYALDTIRVNRTAALPLSQSSTQSTCGTNTGSVTVTVGAGGTGPYTGSIDAGSPVTQASNVFTFPNLGAGPHTVTVTDANGCTNTITATVTNVGTLPSNVTTTGTSCPGLNNGTVTVTPTLGTAPFTFVLDGSGPGQATGAFTGLASGSHTVTFTDANLCTGTATFNIAAGTAITSTSTSTSTSCAGVNDGTITITPTSGTGPYTYTIDGNPNASNVFTNLAPGSHSIVITDAQGCTGTRTIFIFTGSNLSSSFTTTIASCSTASNGTATVTPTSGTAPYVFTWDGVNLGATNSVTNLAPGSHTVKFTDANGCSSTVRTFTIGSGSGISASGSTTATSCPGVNNGTITITPSSGTAPYTYTLAGSPQSSNVFTNMAAGGPYIITVTDTYGCITTVFANVSAGPGITGTLSSTNTSCPSVNDGTITVTPSSGTAPYTYALDAGTYQSSATFTNVPSGPHTITFKDANGCTGTLNVTINQGPAMTGTATTTSTSCPNLNDGTITVTAGSGTAPYTFALDGSATFQSSNVFTNVSAGSHTVTIKDANGCTGPVTVTVAQGPSLTGTTTSTPTSCPGVNDGTITVTATSGTAPYTYSLDGITFQTSSTFGPLAAASYTITIKDANGCTGTVTGSIAQGAALTGSVTNTNPPCANINDGVITIVPTVPGNYTYTLNPTLPGQVVQVNNPTFTGLAPGSYTYLFVNSAGCQGSGTTSLTTNSPLTTTVSMTQPLCNGNANGTITLNASGGVAAYQYSKDLGATYQASGTFNGLAAGTYTFRIKDNVGCIKDTIVTLGEPTVLNASATSLPGTCNGNDGSISVTGSGGTPAYQYSVDNGTTYQSSPNFVVSGGAYPNVLVKDANGCTASTNVNVVLIDNMFLEVGNDTTICYGSSDTLRPNTNTEVNWFLWTSPNANINTLNYDTIKNPIATPTDTATYYLWAKWGVCERRDTITINVLHKPIPYAGPDLYVCYNDHHTIITGSASNLSGAVTYAWTPVDSLGTPNNYETTAYPDTTQQYVLTVSDLYGCNFNVTDTMTIFVQPPVPAFAGNDTIAVLGQPHQLMGSGGVQYDWTPATPLNFASIANPMATLFNDQRFIVKVTDIGGCIGYDTVYVQVYSGPTYKIPNSFTPNGDGLNDIFRAIPVGIAYTEWFRIFNRYGELVFSSNQWMKGWDGNAMGKPAAPGAYVWMVKGVDKNGKIVEMKGTVLLIR